MNFIIERQEYTAAQLARLQEYTATQLTRLIEMQTDHDERIARFESSYVTIAQLIEKHDKQLDSVTEGLNNATDEIAKLASLVNRYIAARGNGSDGGA